MTYLAKIMYRVPETLFWIKFHVYREGHLLIEANSDFEAREKMRQLKNEDSTIAFYQIDKPI